MSGGYSEASTSQSWMDQRRRSLEKVIATGRAPVTKMAGNAEVGHQYVGVERYVLRVKVRSTVRHESTKGDRTVSEWPRHRSNAGPPYRGLQTVLSCHGIGPVRDLPTVDYSYRQYGCHGRGPISGTSLPWTIESRPAMIMGGMGMSHLHVLPFLYTLTLHNYLLTRGSGVIVSSC